VTEAPAERRVAVLPLNWAMRKRRASFGSLVSNVNMRSLPLSTQLSPLNIICVWKSATVEVRPARVARDQTSGYFKADRGGAGACRYLLRGRFDADPRPWARGL